MLVQADALTFAGLPDCIGWVEEGHASVLLHAEDRHNLSVVAVTVKLAATCVNRQGRKHL